jgi:hypothetical protein
MTTTTLHELYGIRYGLNVDNLEETSDEEIDAFLNHARRARGPLDPGPQYEMRANAMWLHTRPDFAKLHMRVLDAWHTQGVDPIISASSFANLHTYINQAWLPGIENCTRGLQLRGVSKAQLLEGIMHAQMSGGMRGLECVYQALGIILTDYVERAEPAAWPEGWAPDMEPFYCGLDPTTKELTDQDRRNLEDWYDRTIGWMPPRVAFMAKHDPRSLKATRARWEGCFRGALPKQMMPYFMLRHNTVVGNKDGLREAVLLAKAWGMAQNYIVNTIIQGAYYYTGMERLDLVAEAVGDLL